MDVFFPMLYVFAKLPYFGNCARGGGDIDDAYNGLLRGEEAELEALNSLPAMNLTRSTKHHLRYFTLYFLGILQSCNARLRSSRSS